jgi:DNA-binding PadR family transcriptional regulator
MPVEGRTDSGLEIRRLLLLTRLRNAPKGLTMQRLVNDCEKVPGWKVPGKTSSEIVRMVLQSLIDDRLVAVKKNFELTAKGREYLEDPLKWQIDGRTTEDIEQRLFWESIYEVFDKAYRGLRSKIKTGIVKGNPTTSLLPKRKLLRDASEK